LPSHTEPKKGSLAIVGLGPGHREYMTPRALKVIAGADYVIGNALYLDPLEPLLSGKNVIRSSMGKEVERAQQAIELARSHAVAIVSGGDAGVYGMAGIVLEVLEHSGAVIDVEVIPGVTAANAAASRIGSPLSGDFAVISLSDLLTPLEVIEQRLDAVFSVGIPVVLYNPKSRGRPHNFALAIAHARKYLGAETPIAIVRNALRDGEEVIVTTLADVEKVESAVDMHSNYRRKGEQNMEDG
jgi:precorrin-3B C17-methyltransferase